MANEPPAQARNRSSKVWALSRPQGMSLSTLQLGPRRWTEDAPTAGPAVRGAGPPHSQTTWGHAGPQAPRAEPHGQEQGRLWHLPSQPGTATGH